MAADGSSAHADTRRPGKGDMLNLFLGIRGEKQVKGFYSETDLQIKGGAGNFHSQHLVRARTGSGEWAGVYVVDEEGTARLWSRQTRWEPLKAVRARVSASLGVGKGAQS